MKPLRGLPNPLWFRTAYQITLSSVFNPVHSRSRYSKKPKLSV